MDSSNSSVIKAAFLSSILEVIYTHPIDVIKTHQQNNNSFSFNRSLFKGITSRAVGIVPIRTSFWTGQHISDSLGIINPLSKSLLVGMIQTSIDTPIENIKIAQIYNLKKYSFYRGFIPHYMRNSVFLYSFIKSNEFFDNKLVSGFVGGFIGSIMSHPFDSYKTIVQTNKKFTMAHYKHLFNGLGARCAICSMSMTIGNWSYNYLLNNVFD